MPARVIRIDGEHLGCSIGSAAPNVCLDIDTGDIVPVNQCPGDEIGEGRPGIAAGKRYIRIPSLDEIATELKDQLRGERPPDDGLIDPDYSAFCDVNDQLMAEEVVALNWVRSFTCRAACCGSSRHSMGTVTTSR